MMKKQETIEQNILEASDAIIRIEVERDAALAAKEKAEAAIVEVKRRWIDLEISNFRKAWRLRRIINWHYYNSGYPPPTHWRRNPKP